jgi:dipeptidyl aminopeptidase/acylaminoacyl peptidase
MAFASGHKFGSCTIIELIGAGGVGEVYSARDERLGRQVALKVLAEGRGIDPQARQRFEREARVLGSLNHRNIATLHGLEDSGGVQALVMELIDGESLDLKLAHAPGNALAVDAAVDIARQIVDALDAAHSAGIIHRDLKPANIRIRPDGTVKVLDFGLGRAAAGDSGRSDAATVTMTTGAIAGTPPYMSPEQAKGAALDRRTDIWSFGCVLYEMLAGRRAFDGDGTAATLARVIEREPDWDSLPPTVPEPLRSLLQQCMEKDPQRRRRDAHDLGLDLERSATSTPARRATPARRVSLAVAGIAAVAAGALGVLLYRFIPHELRAAMVTLEVTAPEDTKFATSLLEGSGAPVGGRISPDGGTLAFTARDRSGTFRLWVRSLTSPEARQLPGTDGAALPFWSPDGAAIAFFARGRLWRIAVNGDSLQDICAVSRGQGGSWSRQGTIVFAPGLRQPLFQVNAKGGKPVAVTQLGLEHRAHRFPDFLADGEHFFYHAEALTPEESGIFIGSVTGGTGQRLLAADTGALRAPGERLLYVRDGTLYAQRFNKRRLRIAGDPVEIARGVSTEGSAPVFSVSDTNVLTYRRGPAASDEQQFGWYDRSGKLLGLVGVPGAYRGVDLSPDGRRIAVHEHRGAGGDIRVLEPDGGVTRVTFEPAFDNSSPVWSPDGQQIAFGSLRNGRWGLYSKAASGEGAEKLLLESSQPKIPASWSRDGRYLVYWLYAPGDIHLWMLPLAGDAQPVRMIDAPTRYDGHAQVSPDGRLVAYVATTSGRMEIYVRAFPQGSRAWQVSRNGGLTPRWRGDGRELYYASSYDHAGMTAVTIDAEHGEVRAGPPRVLFAIDMAIVPHSTAVQNFHTYSVSPDGERFLIPVSASAVGAGADAPITVVLNWINP